jgi:eukaryotic-like serine/threonine-protein kinase
MVGLEGRTLDRYELRQMIGKGGMADVYLGYDPRFERTVAIKVFKRDDDELLMRFIREARLMASLRHPHLMPVYDAGDSILDGVVRYYIVMPFMEGGTLRSRVRSAPLSLQETCRYLGQIADALDYIHQRGIIHRDIKSSNVLLDAEDRCYLSDFGIARTVTDATMTTSGGVLGTVDYVAPELFEEERKADAYSDLYSLGILAFEVVTGRLPFAAESQIALVSMHINKPPPSPRSLVPDLPMQTERVMLKALAKRPEWRYGSASAFAKAFCQSLTARSETGISSQMTRIESPYDTEVAEASSSLAKAPVARSPSTRSTEGPHYAPGAGSFVQAPVGQSRAMTVRRKKRSSPARNRGIVVGVLALLALLAVVGPMVFASLAISQNGHGAVTPSVDADTQTAVTQVQHTATTMPTLTPTPNMTATVQAATATAVQQARQATVTAIARQTATVQAQASATAGVIQTATAGNATYADALNNANATTTRQANWDQNDSCAFQGDGYHVSAKKVFGKGQFKGCMESGYSYTNATISVDITMLGGHAGGVFFRVNTDLFRNYAGYLFALDSQGNYTVSRSNNFSSGDVPLKEGTVASGFRAGYNVKNTLQIIANGSSLSFYVNGVFLDKEQDATFTSGDIAFFASATDNSTDADIAYSNIRVFTTT